MKEDFAPLNLPFEPGIEAGPSENMQTTTYTKGHLLYVAYLIFSDPVCMLCYLNGKATRTGPKISSTTQREVMPTPVMRVGG